MKRFLLAAILSLIASHASAGGSIYANANASGRIYVDSQERLLIPNNGYKSIFGGGSPQLQITDTTEALGSLWTFNGGSGAFSTLRLGTSGGSTLGSDGVTGTSFGSLLIYGDDGTGVFPVAEFSAALASTAGVGSLPSKWVWATTPSGSTTRQNVMQIDSSGHLTVNLSGGVPQFFGAIFPNISDSGITASQASLGAAYYGNDALGAHLLCGKSRGATLLSHGAVQAGDVLCTIGAEGDDNANLQRSADWIAVADGNASTGIVPGRWEAWTANTSGTPTKALTIDSSQNVTFQGVLEPSGGRTTLSGTTSGSVIWSQPFQGASYKKFVAFFSSYENNTAVNQTVTFPATFSHPPVITVNGTSPVLTVSPSTTTFTITAPNNTTTYSGFIIIEGY